MRTKLIAGLAAALLALPMAAAADEVADICYADPEAPECVVDGEVDVLGDTGDADADVDQEESEELTGETERLSVTEDADDERQSAAAMVATGVDSTVLLGLALALLLGGSALLLGMRRRASRTN